MLLPIVLLLVLSGFQVPSLTAPVTDQAGMISALTETEINNRLQSLRAGGGSQIAVLTVASLEGLPIEEASIKVTDEWKLGSAKADNGVLLLIALEDRSLRIEVGQGLEGALTDAYSRRIIDNVISPEFRAGRFEEGIIAGLNAIVQHTDPDSYPLITGVRPAAPAAYSQEPPGRMSWFGRIFLIIIIAVMLSTRTGRLILFSMLLSGGRGRGGSGGGFGGFSGGGGGFSGGGASGKW